ncbi:MAG TPA: NUDIX domain-containing protein [Sulfitobacter litoralis]|uniref:NUDIX domain-containing protein n=1 Tax=Sulfitobacter litoralis TaxID=335975 RepID=A0A7V1A4A1_9RHOB|nr:NUDIX hydrolase [Sulfitobacter litoralis]HDY94128.1 NUDIX domain-containing protein [Sulfitobacter litoralis]HDZ51988.1 NUDIX domain-containing protein [Sulfitobacter litoralis]
MMRRVGKPPVPGKTYRSRPGVYAILPLKGRFLLTAQLRPEVDVQLPGGGVDLGESPLQTLHREIMEEIGWTIARPRRLGAFRRFAYMPEYDMWAEKICQVYVAHPVHQVAPPIEPDHATVVMSGEEAISVLGNDGDRFFLDRFLAMRP